MNNEEYIKKWLNNSLSESEEREFVSSELYKELNKLDGALKYFSAPEFNVESALIEVNRRKTDAGRNLMFPGILMRVAAVVTLAILGYYFFIYSAATTFETSVAQKEAIRLPDNTQVQLNAQSRLAYDNNRWESARNVNLSGEAFFKVTKGSTFDVKTSAGIVRVLGTEFNVKSRVGLFEVNCFEGHVLVVLNADSIHLYHNEGFRILNGQSTRLSLNNETIPAWVNHESSFSSIPFAMVIEEFERQYNVKITTKNVDLEQLFSGNFTHNDIDLALKSISLPLNLNVEQPEENHIVFSVE